MERAMAAARAPLTVSPTPPTTYVPRLLPSCRTVSRLLRPNLGFAAAPHPLLKSATGTVVGPAGATHTHLPATLLVRLYVSYEPGLFPGLIYRQKQPKIVLLIFVSRKIVLTGTKVREERYTAFENIYSVLIELKKSKQYKPRTAWMERGRRHRRWSILLLPIVCDAKWGCKLSNCFGGFFFLVCRFATLCMEDNLCTFSSCISFVLDVITWGRCMVWRSIASGRTRYGESQGEKRWGGLRKGGN